MTDEQIIEMARQVAGMITIHANGEATYSFYEYQLKTFTNLVAQHEREACAKLCESESSNVAEHMFGKECAAAIRARGQA